MTAAGMATGPAPSGTLEKEDVPQTERLRVTISCILRWTKAAPLAKLKVFLNVGACALHERAGYARGVIWGSERRWAAIGSP